jgi:uncharacterized membrane protein
LPYCTNCGTEVHAQAAFCHSCGSPQAKQPRYADPMNHISDRTASMLCYIPVFGVLPAIIFLAVQKYRNNPKVRFDAFQSLYLFVAFLIVSSVFPAFMWLTFHGFHNMLIPLLKLVLFLVWIYLLVKAAQEQQVRLPVIGDLAARSAAEQL